MVGREDVRELAGIAGMCLLLVLLGVARFVLAVVVRVVGVFVYVVIIAAVVLAGAYFFAG